MVAAVQETGTVSLTDNRYRLGVWVLLASVVMLFTSLTSAYIVRIAAANDWRQIPMPRVLLVSTVVLLLSSITFETGKRKLKQRGTAASRRWVMLTTVLGFAFLALQVIAWRQLISQGVYLASNSQSSFFYLLTATHGVHLLGGLLALVYLMLRSRRMVANDFTQARSVAVTSAAALYWHFMDALWIYLFLLLFFWR
jgi:cytochrome c oxidase subunit III